MNKLTETMVIALDWLNNNQHKEFSFINIPPCEIEKTLIDLGWKATTWDSIDFDDNEVLYKHPNYNCGLYLNYDGFTWDVFMFREDKDDDVDKEWRKQ